MKDYIMEEKPADDDEAFWGFGGKAAFLNRIRIRTSFLLQEGVDLGHWPSFNAETLTPNPPAKTFKLSDFPEKALMAHVMAKAKIFPSVSEAKRNGWDRPIEVGQWTVTKKKILVEVIDDESNS